MFWFIIDVLTLRRLGLGRPFRYAILLFLIGGLIAGVIYAAAVFHAVAERSTTNHVQEHAHRR